MNDRSAHYVGKLTQKAILFGPTGDLLLVKGDQLWEFPGGTFEFDETLIDGLIRELREELGIRSKIGPPVEAIYGGWVDEAGNPMVAIIYRAETQDSEVVLNEEHDEYAWVPPEKACELLRSPRYQRAIRRATEIGNDDPFVPVTDPYHEYESSTEDILAHLHNLRESDTTDQ